MKDGSLIRCSCGKLYRVYMHTVVDQSACPDCLSGLEREYEEQERRAGRKTTTTDNTLP